MRAQHIPPRHCFPEHAHAWSQLVYAISGVLTVSTAGQSFVITPDEALWLPTRQTHRVGSLLGAEFRSLWVADPAGPQVARTPTVFRMRPLLRALIVEATALDQRADPDGYRSRVMALILDQLARVEPLPNALPWPKTPQMTALCEALYLDPCDTRTIEDLAHGLHMSPRTLARRFNDDLGLSLRSWRRRLRLFRAVELLGGGMGVTQVAMELGYGSTSAFSYAFRTQMGCSPQTYMDGCAMRRG